MTGEPVMKNTGYKTYLAGEFVYINTFNDYGDYALDFEKVTGIIVKNNILVPTTALTTWDLSEAQDKSVIAYINEDNLESIGNNETSYEIVIGGQGGVIAPEDSEYLFAGGYYRNLKRLNLQYLDTSRVTNMNAMFGGVRANKLYLSNFNTSKVTNMSDMFCDCQNLTELNISNFDTSKVTDMSSMLSDCSGLTSLDLTSFDTSAIDKSSAIGGTAQMFWNCTNLTSILVSSRWDKMNAYYMFQNCGTDHVTIVG